VPAQLDEAAEVEDGNRPGVTHQESEQLRELKRRHRLLEQENEVLRKAAAYLGARPLRRPFPEKTCS
jgi:transposase